MLIKDRGDVCDNLLCMRYARNVQQEKYQLLRGGIKKRFFWEISPKSVYPRQGFCEIWENER